jgi:hypothetical protein
MTWWHGELHHLGLIGLALAFMYAIGLVFWEFSVFFRQDYWNWGQVGQGFIWPWVWLKARRRQR